MATFRSIGTVTSNFNTSIAPGAPAGFVAGDTLVVGFVEFAGSDAPPDLSAFGFTRQSDNTTSKAAALYTKTALGGDTMPSANYGNQFSACFCAAYIGATEVLDRASVSRAGNLTSGFTIPGWTAPPSDNVTAICLAMRNNSTATGVSISNFGNFTQRATRIPNAASRPLAVFEDNLMTAPEAGTLGTQGSSPADGTAQTTQSVVIFLQSATTAPSVVGFVPEVGNPALSSPRNFLQFQGVGRVSAPAPVIAAPLTGLSVSMSVAYGPPVAPISDGFVPQPGPGNVGPFNNRQFLSRFGDTSVPSPSTANISGIAVSFSIVSGAAIAAGNLSGLAMSSSVAYGPGFTLLSGPIFGLAISQSVAYASIAGAVLFDGGLSVSMSWGIGSLSKAPIIVNTATGGQHLTPDPNVNAPAGYGGQQWGANGGDGTPVGGGVSGQTGWDNPIAETISTAQRQANYLVNGKPLAALESNTSLPTTTPDSSLPTGGNNAG